MIRKKLNTENYILCYRLYTLKEDSFGLTHEILVPSGEHQMAMEKKVRVQDKFVLIKIGVRGDCSL